MAACSSPVHFVAPVVSPVFANLFAAGLDSTACTTRCLLRNVTGPGRPLALPTVGVSSSAGAAAATATSIDDALEGGVKQERRPGWLKKSPPLSNMAVPLLVPHPLVERGHVRAALDERLDGRRVLELVLGAQRRRRRGRPGAQWNVGTPGVV
eukprot:scaffold58266_cov63-Phaeocystis_antarctica.AAC.3